MSARRLVALVLAGAALAGLGLAAQQPPQPQGGGATSPPPDTAAVTKRAVYAALLPDSAGRDIAQRWCLLCHSAMLITQQAKDSTAWEKTLAQMEKWGVVVTPEEHDTLRTYLTKCFGPRVKPAPARPAPPATAAGDTTRAPSGR